jgi:hypothetical protein
MLGFLRKLAEYALQTFLAYQLPNRHTVVFLATLRVGDPENQPLIMSANDWSKALWDSIPAYNLTKEIVDSYLQGLFGYYDFYTTVSTAADDLWPHKFQC